MAAIRAPMRWCRSTFDHARNAGCVVCVDAASSVCLLLLAGTAPYSATCFRVERWMDGPAATNQPLLWLRSVLCVPSGHLLRDVSFGLMYIFVQVLDGRLQKAIYNPFATIILVCCSTRRRSDARRSRSRGCRLVDKFFWGRLYFGVGRTA